MSLERFLVSFCGRLGSYAIMRNYDDLPRSANGSDIDILLGVGAEAQCDDALHFALSEVGGIVLGSARTVGFRKFVVLGEDAESPTGWWGVRLDLCFEFKFRGAVRLLSEDGLLSVSSPHNGLLVLPENWADLIGFLKHILHHANLPQRYLVGAVQVIENDRKRLETIFQPMGSTALNKFTQLIQWDSNDPKGATAEILSLRRFLLRQDRQYQPVRYAHGRLRFVSSKLRRIVSPPGLVVSILGTDGAGKSTIIEAIRPVLEEATHADLQVRHLRPTLLPPLGKLKSDKGPTGIRGPVTDPHGSRPAGSLGSIVRLLWLWADYVLGHWLVVRPHIAKSPIVFLFDRYADDLALDPRRFRLGAFQGLARLVPRLVPRPDVTIALYAEPEVIHARKPELPLAEVARQVTELKNWVAQRPEAVLISTGGSIEEARDAVLTAIASAAAARS